jgi:hypothetical protein
MAVSITLNFDDTWAARLAPMTSARVEEARNNRIIVELIEAHPTITSIDELTVKQKAKLWILFRLLGDLCQYEGEIAAVAGRQAVVDDIELNFPLEVGDA